MEAAHLAAVGSLEVEGGARGVRERGRAVEGERFDRRLAAYTALREAGLVPKTGFKFGADFRTYEGVASVDELGHAEALVRVLPGDATVPPRELSLDVRLAGGVRKQLWYALVDGDGTSTAGRTSSDQRSDGSDVAWLEVARLTP